jgi:hypothetical protein
MSEKMYEQVLGIELPQKCLLCCSNVPTREGHIHSRLVSRYLQQRLGTRFRFSLNPFAKPQDTVKPKAFCDSCEELFGRSERLFARNLMQKYFQSEGACLEYGGFLYPFALSVVWRALALTSLMPDRRLWTPQVAELYETWRLALREPELDPGQTLFLTMERDIADDQLSKARMSREQVRASIVQSVMTDSGLCVYVQLGPFHFFGWDKKHELSSRAHLSPFLVVRGERIIPKRDVTPEELLAAIVRADSIHRAQFRRFGVCSVSHVAG